MGVGTGTAAATTRAEVTRLIAPVIEADGLDLEDVEVSPAGARTVVRVVLDRDGGLDLDGVAGATTAIDDALEAGDAIAGTYVLEVTSRGVDRPLTAPRHWRRARGRLVEVTRREGAPLIGRVRETDDEGATLLVEPKPVKGRRPRPGAGAEVRVAYADVVSAVVQVEFSHPGRDASEPAQEPDGVEEET